MDEFNPDSEILDLGIQLYSNLKIKQIPNNIQSFFQFPTYEFIFKKLFPNFQQAITEIAKNQQLKPKQQMRQLLKVFSDDIIKQQIRHISGSNIIEGDRRHAFQFLQLLTSISQKLLPKDSLQRQQAKENNSNNSTAQSTIQVSKEIAPPRIQDVDNISEFIIREIRSTRKKLAGMRKVNQTNEDKELYDNIRKQKEQYKYLLRNYIEYKRNNEEKMAEQEEKINQRNVQRQEKQLTHDAHLLNEEMARFNEAQKLRSANQKFLQEKKIKELIFNLEKNRNIDIQSQFKEQQTQRNQQFKHKVDSMKNQYHNVYEEQREELVNEQEANKKKRREDQVEKLKTIKELKSQGQTYLDQLKNVFYCEQDKLALADAEDCNVEKEINKLYSLY